ncbi:MAG: TolC family protein [Desulfovibrionaceae bacterium]
MANTLQKTVSSALQYNPQLKIYQEGIEISERELMKARSGWYPTLDVSGQVGAALYNDQSTRRIRAFNARDNLTKEAGKLYFSNSVDAVARQSLFSGLATWGATDVAAYRIKSADFRLIDNAEAIALDAILAHLNVLRFKKIIAFSKKNVAQHERILVSQTERRRLGAGSVADVSQTQARLARSKASLAESINAYRDAVANYVRVTGVEVGDDLAEIPNIPSTFASYESALASTRSSNPKINALLMDVKALQSQVTVSRAGFMPEVYLEGAYNYSYAPSSVTTDMYAASVMLRMDWNLFNGLSDYASLRSDLARARQGRYEVLQLVDLLAEETKNTWNRYVASIEQKNFYSSARKYSAESLETYLKQFQVGQRSLLDVLDAENELYSNSVLEVSASTDSVATQYRILALGGKLLSNLGVTPAQIRTSAK